MAAQILLVDDNLLQASTRAAILSRSGAKVVIANGAADALDLLSKPELRQALSLMVTDHLMPGMNGPQLVGQVRDLLPYLPILVLSGLAEAESEYETLGVTFRLKPCPPDELIRLCSMPVAVPTSKTA